MKTEVKNTVTQIFNPVTLPQDKLGIIRRWGKLDSGYDNHIVVKIGENMLINLTDRDYWDNLRHFNTESYVIELLPSTSQVILTQE